MTLMTASGERLPDSYQRLSSMLSAMFIPIVVAAYLLVMGSAFWAFANGGNPKPAIEPTPDVQQEIREQEIPNSDARLICQCAVRATPERI